MVFVFGFRVLNPKSHFFATAITENGRFRVQKSGSLDNRIQNGHHFLMPRLPKYGEIDTCLMSILRKNWKLMILGWFPPRSICWIKVRFWYLVFFHTEAARIKWVGHKNGRIEEHPNSPTDSIHTKSIEVINRMFRENPSRYTILTQRVLLCNTTIAHAVSTPGVYREMWKKNGKGQARKCLAKEYILY